MKPFNDEIILDFELLENYLGPPVRKKHDEYEWQCPLCAYYGGDSHRDNLKFNTQKGVLQCFADPEHSRALLSEIYTQEWQHLREKQQLSKNNICTEQELTEDDRKMLKEKYKKYTETLKKQINPILEESLLYIRGLSIDTAKAVGLGYSNEKGCWAIPTFRYTTSTDPDNIDIIGFEYRPIDFSKEGIHREAGQSNTLAMINQYTDKTEVLAIVEGYFDGYALYQHLVEKGQIEYYHITTCSNGVQSLLKQLSTVEFDKYRKWYLFIDNDEAGRNVAGQILERYPFITDITLNCGCKDFNEHYLKCIKKQVLF